MPRSADWVILCGSSTSSPAARRAAVRSVAACSRWSASALANQRLLSTLMNVSSPSAIGSVAVGSADASEVSDRKASDSSPGAVRAACESAAAKAGFARAALGATLTGVPFYARHGYVETEREETPLPTGETMTVVHMTKLIAG